MNETEFVNWLKGFIDGAEGEKGLTKSQVDKIKKKLNGVSANPLFSLLTSNPICFRRHVDEGGWVDPPVFPTWPDPLQPWGTTITCEGFGANVD